jgi:hypothetical protein
VGAGPGRGQRAEVRRVKAEVRHPKLPAAG